MAQVPGSTSWEPSWPSSSTTCRAASLSATLGYANPTRFATLQVQPETEKVIPIKKLASVLVVVGLVALASPAAQAASPTTRSSRGTPVVVAWPLSPTGPQLPTNGTLFGAHIGIDPIWTGSDRTSSWQDVEASGGRKLVI